MRFYNKLNETNYRIWLNRLMEQDINHFNNQKLKEIIGIEWNDTLIDFANYVEIKGLGKPLFAGDKVFLLTLRK